MIALTTAERDEMRRVDEAATPRPWKAVGATVLFVDAAFIAISREAVPRLLAALTKAEHDWRHDRVNAAQQIAQVEAERDAALKRVEELREMLKSASSGHISGSSSDIAWDVARDECLAETAPKGEVA